VTDVERPLPACSCCAEPAPPTPEPVDNPAGAAVLRYRAGTAATFLAAMQRDAARTDALRPLRSRTLDDPTVGLLDAWACTLDVLTFYTERIATEGYLRTATETGSLVELARAVGYERGPGRASATWLVVTLEDVPGAPPLVPLPVGLQVASVPGPGEVPVTFETTEAVDARPEWNAMPAATSVPQQVGVGSTGVHLAGVATNLRVGDWLLVVGRDDSVTAGTWALRSVRTVTALPALGSTAVTWEGPLAAPLPDPADVRVYALRQRAAVFGATAPDWRTLPDEVRDRFRTRPGGPVLQRQRATKAVVADKELAAAAVVEGPDDWPGFTVVPSGAPANTVDLDAAYPRVAAGGWLVLQKPAVGSQAAVTGLYRITAAREGSRADFAVSSRTTRVTLSGPDVAGAFGAAVRTTVVLADSERLQLASTPRTDPVHGREIDLAGPVTVVPTGRHVAVSGTAPALRVAEAVHTLALTRASGSTAPLHPGETLTVTAPPTTAGTTATWPVTRADGDTGTVLATATQLLPVTPAAGAPVLTEIAEVAAGIDPTAPTTSRLCLAADLAHCYDRASVRIAANVAPATHGSTQVEVLGSGDARTAFQRFRLRQAPLTYLEAGSTLEVRVDGLLWREVPSLLGAGPGDRVYTVRIADDGAVTVHFGDGVTGARPPTGVENVTATYRVGTGLSGRLPAGRLTLAMTRPLGLRSVTNPLPTGLAADPDAPELLRANAARIARAVDRVVSLTDYEDFARGTPGFAKARASWAWEDEQRVVHLTVAGEDGQPVDEPSRAALQAAVLAAGIPRQRAVVHVADTDTFDAELRVVPDPALVAGDVQEGVRAAVLAAFGFDARELGQAVAASEIVAVAHGVPGVVAVTLVRLTATPTAATPTPSAGPPPAGLLPRTSTALLLVNRAGLTVEPA
jgi:predicted phage baseplate assembly protein